MRTGNAKKILVVEDSATQAEFIKFNLGSTYEVFLARDGVQGLEQVAAVRPNLIISDINMPEMDGYEFCKRVKAHEQWSKIPVILLTSFSEMMDVIKGLECGADYFITKPYEVGLLLSRVSWALSNQNLVSDEREDGVEVVYCGNKYRIQSDRAQILNLLLSTFEATVQKNSELIKAQNELKAKISELIEAREDALAGTRAKSAFLAAMSHEIRTPMNGVIGMARLMLQTGLTDSQKDYMETIHTSGVILLTLINDILDYSKIQAGKLTFESIPFSPRTILEEVAELLGAGIQAKGLELVYIVDKDVPDTLHGDPGRLRQVIMNLIGNASKFTEKGEILIQAKPFETGTKGDFGISFSIKDTGIGMSQKTISSLFQPFNQADAQITHKYGGTGLGLAISKDLVERMGGSIQVESEPGKGSTFTFTTRFKLKKSDQTKPQKSNGDELANRRVLVVEDNYVVRKFIAAHLASWKMTPSVAENGKKALELIDEAFREKQPFAIVITGIQMSDMNASAFCQKIKSKNGGQSIPVVLLSPSIGHTASLSADLSSDATNSSPGATVRSSHQEFAAILEKPLRPSRLFNSLNLLLVGNRDELLGKSNKPRKSAVVSISKGIRILVVEDNQINQKVALKILENQGYAADAVANGVEAVEAAARIPYDVIFMDCQMPEMDGYQATQIIRKSETKRASIIALTAEASKEDRQKCIDAGMDDYLSKPILIEDLIAILDKWLKPNKNKVQARHAKK